MTVSQSRVLVVGVYADRPDSRVMDLIESFGDVVQKWAPEDGPKFPAINRLIASADVDRFDYLIVSDDDIVVPPNLIDRLLYLMEAHDFALAQPARTPDSTFDHPITVQRAGVIARETTFVEIGPLVCIRRDLFPVLLPFDERSPMGWGYDLVWPRQLAALHKRMGIIDAVPVQHATRPQGVTYDKRAAATAMAYYLGLHDHLEQVPQ